MPLPGLIRRFPALLLFLLGCVAGGVVLQDYGVGWDEHMSNVIGIINYRYVFEGDPMLLTHPNRDYGVAFELPAVMLQRLFSLEDTRHIYLLRHALSYLLFLGACCVMFKLAFFIYRSHSLALLAFLLLYLHPLLFAHAFFNSKDLPFLSFFVMGMYAVTKAIGTGSWRWFALAGVFTGVLTATRILGLCFFGLSALFIVLRIFTATDKARIMRMLAIYTCSAALVLYACWPYLWTAPFSHLAYAFGSMAKFRWDLPVLFNGEFIPATQVPAGYVPTWFVITTPVFMLVAGLWGFLLLVWKALKNMKVLLHQELLLHHLFYLCCFLAPVLAVIVMRAVVYDSWRHLFFIYPGFVMICLFALNSVSRPRLRRAAVAAVMLLFIPVLWFMFLAHPFQHVYFNALAGHRGPEELRKRYELDYWGLSYKQGLEYILRNDTSGLIRITGQNDPCAFNVGMLPVDQRRRLQVVQDRNQADYFLSNYRWYPQGYDDQASQMEEVHSFRVLDNSVMTVFKVKK